MMLLVPWTQVTEMNWESNLWDMRDNKSKLVYDNMLRLFVNGYVPDYLKIQTASRSFLR